MKFKIAGVQHYKKDLIEILDANDDYLMKKSEILGNYDEDDVIYEYDIYDGPAELVPEPENEHDRNAIAVMAEGVKIGYVPAELCDEVRDLIDTDHSYDVAIMGGPYKEVVSDDIGDLQIKKGSLNFTATLTISKKQIIEKHDSVIPKSAPLPEDPVQPKSTGARVYNYIGMAMSILLILMALILLIVSPVPAVIAIIGGVLGFMYFKKRNK